MITVGIDLAAEPANTGVARLEWRRGACRVTFLAPLQDDDQIMAGVADADKVGLDCPLGWPDAFVRFVVAHRDGHVSIPPGQPGSQWRRPLANRATDLYVAARPDLAPLRPLSVSSDMIARPAMRAAGLLARLADAGRPVDRSGAGLVVEAYPAASLKYWGLAHNRYKGRHRASLPALATSVIERCSPWLDLGPHLESFTTSDHCFDAVIAALTARAAATGRTSPIPSEHAAAAAREGWIGLPTCPLPDLIEGG